MVGCLIEHGIHYTPRGIRTHEYGRMPGIQKSPAANAAGLFSVMLNAHDMVNA
jgi:hypothetical protein